jgi:membrane-bound ClpP family serine protease
MPIAVYVPDVEEQIDIQKLEVAHGQLVLEVQNISSAIARGPAWRDEMKDWIKRSPLG